MIFINRKVYRDLIKITKSENCGFVAGHGSNYKKIFKIKNVATKDNTFRMHFFDKMKAVIKMFLQGYNSLIIYHVHKGVPYMSIEDVRQAIPDIVYLIICDHALYFYIIKQYGSERKIRGIEHKILD